MDSSRKLKILFLALSPYSRFEEKEDKEYIPLNDYLDLGLRYQEISQAIYDSKFKKNCELYAGFSARAQDLTELLDKYNPNIVHVCGHANPNPEQSGLYFLDDDYKTPRNLHKEEIKNTFQVYKRDIRILYLDACNTEEIAKSITAEENSIDYVIGTKSSVSDMYARAFVRGFYRAILSAESIAKSVKAGIVEAHNDDQRYYAKIYSPSNAKSIHKELFFPLSITPDMDKDFQEEILNDKDLDFRFIARSNETYDYEFTGSNHKYFKVDPLQEEFSFNTDLKQIVFGIHKSKTVQQTAQSIIKLFSDDQSMNDYIWTLIARKDKEMIDLTPQKLEKRNSKKIILQEEKNFCLLAYKVTDIELAYKLTDTKSANDMTDIESISEFAFKPSFAFMGLPKSHKVDKKYSIESACKAGVLKPL